MQTIDPIDANAAKTGDATTTERVPQAAAADGKRTEFHAGCFLCGCNCGLTIKLGPDGRVARVTGDKQNPHSHGFVCNKGLNVGTTIDSPHRLTRPLERVGDELVEVSWDDALDKIGQRLRKVRRKHGGRAIGMALGGSAHTTIQVMLGYQTLRSLGSRNAFGPPGLELNSKFIVNQKLYGCSQMDGYPDFENAAFIILMGSNPVVSWPMHGPSLKAAGRDPGRRLVVVDPRVSESARLADVHWQVRPTTDVYLLLALLQVVTSERLYDEALVAAHSRGIDVVARAVSRFTPEAVEPIVDIPAEEVREVARGFATAETAVLHYDMGVIANHHSTLLSWAAQNLMFITGRSGVPGGSVIAPSLMNMNALEGLAFGGAPYKSRVRRWSEVTGFLPVTVLQDEILTPGKGQVRAMIVSGCNPLRGYTNSDKMERAFSQLELLVSIDPFLTEVGRLADFVLPACSFHEQDSASFMFHCIYQKPFVQLSRKIREPLGESRPEWMIYRDIRQRAGVVGLKNQFMQVAFGLAGRAHKLRGNTDDLNEQEALLRVITKAAGTSWDELVANPHGLVLDKKRFDFFANIRKPGRRAHLDDAELLAGVDRLPLEPPRADPAFPLVLSTTARTLANVNTMYRNQPWLEKRGVVENPLLMHPSDGARAGVEDGGLAMLTSRTARAEVRVAFSEDVRPGAVFLSHGWGLTTRDPASCEPAGGVVAAKFLPDDEGDEFSGLPLFSGVPCRVEPAE